ncbi:hypothetical protein BBOMB_0034 [Bifidobacterium bombi DSM 19703]|uniref:Teichoic acid transporter n=2 Tax=Bifidobacterium bombi TaxID=471511 RepID=A0A086BP64_9BIFI|nr:hypothetical protein BBOMB_0034 [Bifidobacterium bombi DSM 19703]
MMSDTTRGRDGHGNTIPDAEESSDDRRLSNQATEIIAGKVEQVPVSKHPVSTIPETDVSWADIQRSRFNPWAWGTYVVLVLLAIVLPYWVGRKLALNHASVVLRVLSPFTPQGITFISWMVSMVGLAFLGLALVESSTWLWRHLFVFALAVEQLFAGACVLKFNFWYSTRVIYAEASALPNAANLGILAVIIGAGVFAVVYVGLLVAIRPDSTLNVFTHSWAAFLMFFFFEAVALLLAIFVGIPALSSV